MVLLDKLWDDAVGGPAPEQGLGRLRKLVTSKPLSMKEEGASSSVSMSMPSTPMTPSTPTTPRTADNIWNRMCHPGSSSRNFGSELFDKPQPNSPTVYDWMYSDDTRSKHHR